MKRLKLRPILRTCKKYLPIILIIALAVFLRFYLLERRAAFDADQEEIAFKAKELLSGNPVLLGPKTSLGGFSIGPGFTYLWALFALFLKGDPIAGAYLSVFLGILFIIGTYLISRKIFSERVGLILSFIIAVSVSFIQWDQNSWAPSLFYLSELITFYGAYISKDNKNGLPLVALGLGLGFQSHFAVFLLLLPLAVYLLFYKPIINRKTLITLLSILIVSILPVILFDLLNGFVNLQRLLSIFTLGRAGVAVPKIKIITTLMSNSSGILWPHFSILPVVLIFAITVLYSFRGIYRDKTSRPLLVLINLFLFAPFLIFLFYKSNFSEYYLMTAVVPFLFLLGYLFSAVKSKYALLLILGIFSFLNVRSFISIYKPMNLYAKEQIVREVIERGGKNGYGVSLSVKPGYGFGYSYLFGYYNAKPDLPPLKNQKKIFTVISPPGYKGIEPMIEVDGVGLRWEGY